MTGEKVWRVDCVVGARPNFVKIAPILRALKARGCFDVRLIHTGQHYDVAMNAVFFEELAIPSPDINLEVGSGTSTAQTANIMLKLEDVLSEGRAGLLLVVGDVNSTVAAALVAAKLQIPVAHVEAGLRSFDRTMPEEINRLVTDRLSELLFASEESAIDNLAKEGVEPSNIVLAGNVMIDSLYASLERAVPARVTLKEIGAGAGFLEKVAASGFGFVTLHRPSNVDDPARLFDLLACLREISMKVPLVFPMHPRTAAMIEKSGLSNHSGQAQMIVTAPLSYLRAIGLMREAKFVITDSGGVQEETTALGVPCLTVRENTERPITIEQGTNILVGTSYAALARAVDEILTGGGKRGRIPPLWDGRAAERIAREVEGYLRRRHNS